MNVPDVSYARSGDVAIAYQAIGEGPPDLVFLPFLSNLYSLWQHPLFAAMGRRLATERRLVLVNTRGMGLSDRPRGLTIEGRMDDVRAVMDDLEIDRAALLGIGETSNTCAVFGATYPDRVERLILYVPYARGIRAPDYPWAPTREEALAFLSRVRDAWGERDHLETLHRWLNPQWADDPEIFEWFVWNHRLTSSPASVVEFRRMGFETDIADVLPTIRVPTLVLSKERNREESDYVARRIPEARHVVLPGQGMAIHENDAAVAAIEEFLQGRLPVEVSDTVLATVLFTDLVDSTARAAEIGDRSAASSSIRPATGFSRASTALRERSAAPARSSRPYRRWGWQFERESTSVSASGWARSSQGSRSTSGRGSRRGRVRGRCSSPARSRISWRDRASPSTIAAITS